MTPTALSERPATEAPALPQDPRDPWFDNAKMLLVTLVVVGHSWTLLPHGEFRDRSYDWLYLWHMPAFVLVTGHLSRRFTYSRRNLRRLVTTLLLPYVVFEGLLALFREEVGGEQLERLWLNPHWPMWYLVVLVLWRLATPLLRRLPQAMPVAVAVSLLGGLVSVETFDTNRALGFLPFFVMGLVAEPRHLEILRGRVPRAAGLAVLLLAVPFTEVVHHQLSARWLYYRTSYGDLGASGLEGMSIRLLLIGVGTAMALAVLAWVPRRRGWFSAMGTGSLVVYLFHGFFVKSASYAGFPAWADAHAAPAFVVATSVAVVVALTLAWRPVRTRLGKVVTPIP